MVFAWRMLKERHEFWMVENCFDIKFGFYGFGIGVTGKKIYSKPYL